jgi:ubiquinol-cytochrome c reductase cytochrome b subunit
MGVVEVWRESSEFWRWRYTEPPSEGREALELFSNEVYETRQAAIEAASSAYPGVPVLELERPPGAPPEPDRGAGRRRLRRRVLVVLGATLALLALRRRRRHAANG